MDAGPQTPETAVTREAPESEHVQLLASGLNAHGQLSDAQKGQDLSSFHPITSSTPSADLRLLNATWSTTTLQISTQIATLGNSAATITRAGAKASDFFDAFGDHNGLLGCLDIQGRLWLTKEGGSRLECAADPDGSPLIGHVALAGNGKVAITFKQAPNGRLCHVLCFDSLDELVAWYSNPAQVSYDAEKQHFMMQGQPRQLLAGTGTFLLRMESGEVYSWGDARYSSLGRSITEVPAERPGVLEALDGLKIKKVACGGWLNAALSEDGACYLWGAGTPGTEQRIRCLREASAGEVVLVELPVETGAEPLDVLDVAVGDNHVVMLAEGDRCFVAGENKNGQLGLGHFDTFVEDWTPVPLKSSRMQSVVCGSKSTYILVGSSG